MKYSYKDVFDLRDYANVLLEHSLKSHKLLCKAKWEFVDVYWKRISDDSEILVLHNVTRDECYKWLAGFITGLEIKKTKVVDKDNSWWSKNVKPLFKITH